MQVQNPPISPEHLSQTPFKLMSIMAIKRSYIRGGVGCYDYLVMLRLQQYFADSHQLEIWLPLAMILSRIN